MPAGSSVGSSTAAAKTIAAQCARPDAKGRRQTSQKTSQMMIMIVVAADCHRLSTPPRETRMRVTQKLASSFRKSTTGASCSGANYALNRKTIPLYRHAAGSRNEQERAQQASYPGDQRRSPPPRPRGFSAELGGAYAPAPETVLFPR
ncbi:hypothetical protein SKAU_G00120320 [Synaphobranchus kaupii]|uniref:Uncharacterized protein n=1 Tax=Synaphobranchus kaupii TaxID=118154 RepID=A0A9Q1J1Z4_SYNKA|nr:hypothetical protein SKAU_G00120320 [Synaphobranchus kaupii]